MTLTPDGRVTWIPNNVGRFAAQFTATASERSTTVLDTVFEVEPFCEFPSTSCSSPSRPRFTTSLDQVRVKAGEELRMEFGATSHLNNGTTTIASVAIPAGAQFTSVTGSPAATAELWWAPTKDDAGLHFACVQASNAPRCRARASSSTGCTWTPHSRSRTGRNRSRRA